MEEYLIARFGKVQASKLIAKVYKRQNQLEYIGKEKSKRQKETLHNHILPRIALYQVLKKKMTAEEAYEVVWDYTKNVICVKSAAQYKKMERIPGFFTLFKKVFLWIIQHRDNWDTEHIEEKKGEFQFEIHRCLWYDTCVACGCKELCKVFCDSDWENFGGLQKMSFSREQSLGTGGNCCDIHFKQEGKKAV